MLQGMAHGKVGDVVFSRLNGEQISRVRNRNPKNPRTNAQLYQRAVMATVMQAYSAGMVIFDHSFQGRSVGAANQRRFMSLNAKKLRDQIAADINGSVALASQVGRVVAPGSQTPAPACLQVSEGTLTDVLFAGSTIPAAASASETVAQFCARLGLVAGDLFTIVAFAADNDSVPQFVVTGSDGVYGKLFTTNFLYARYQVKASALTSTDVIANLGQVLELTESNTNASELTAYTVGHNNNFGFNTVFANYAEYVGTFGWIRSRKDEDLRSTTLMSFSNNQFGIASEYALAAWKQGTAALGDSDLILEGGDI